MSEATFFLFKALMDIFTIGVVFNFLFRLLKVDYYNPIVQGIIRAVDFPSQLLRSIIRPIWTVDLSSFAVAIFIQAGLAEETKVVEPMETKTTITGKRARNKKGQLMADDPNTPDVNEAWEGGIAPK